MIGYLGEGVLHPDLAGGYPILTLSRVSPAWHWGTPQPGQDGVLPTWNWGTLLRGTWGAPPPPPGTGVPLERTLDQWKYCGMEMGYVPGWWTE